MDAVRWYFDFVSPFAYLQSLRLAALPAGVRIEYKPVLFAGLLEHWGQRGPAEIPAKRRFTYRHVQWLAERQGVALRFPPAHPFNPLHALRLALALDCRPGVVAAIFRFVWQDGRDVNDPASWQQLCSMLGVADAAPLIAESDARERLRDNGAEALAAGVFGVPTLVVGGELYWGCDATDMALEAFADAGRFAGGEYARLDALPVAASRKGSLT